MRRTISYAAILLAAGLLIASSSTLGTAQETGAREGGGAAVPAATSTQPDLASQLNGTWQLTVSREQAQQTVNRAIDRVTSQLPIVGGVLANELRDRNHVNQQFLIDISASAIHTRFENSEFRSAPGARVQAPVPDSANETMEYVQVLREGRLEQIFTTARGRRWSMFTPSPDGSTLTLGVTVQSSLLPDVVRYRLEYRRAG